jgi:hypothetical protein
MSVFMHELMANEMHLSRVNPTLVDVEHSTRMIAALCRLHGDTPTEIRMALVQAAVERGVGFIFDRDTPTANP